MTRFKGKQVNWITYYARNGSLLLPNERAISPDEYRKRESEKFAQLIRRNKTTSGGVYEIEMAKLRKLVGLAPMPGLEDDSK